MDIKNTVIPSITYRYPEESSENPFDVNAHGEFFINASGFSYLSENVQDFIDWNKISRIIPFGYKTLNILQRLVLVHAGECIKEWKEDNLEQYNPNINKRIRQNYNEKSYKVAEGGYMIFTSIPVKIKLAAGNEYVNSDNIYRPDNRFNSTNECTWDSIDDAKLYAVQKSCEVNTPSLLIARLIFSYYWH